jgi:hypothetical protein
LLEISVKNVLRLNPEVVLCGARPCTTISSSSKASSDAPVEDLMESLRMFESVPLIYVYETLIKMAMYKSRILGIMVLSSKNTGLV